MFECELCGAVAEVRGDHPSPKDPSTTCKAPMVRAKQKRRAAPPSTHERQWSEAATSKDYLPLARRAVKEKARADLGLKEPPRRLVVTEERRDDGSYLVVGRARVPVVTGILALEEPEPPPVPVHIDFETARALTKSALARSFPDQAEQIERVLEKHLLPPGVCPACHLRSLGMHEIYDLVSCDACREDRPAWLQRQVG